MSTSPTSPRNGLIASFLCLFLSLKVDGFVLKSPSLMHRSTGSVQLDLSSNDGKIISKSYDDEALGPIKDIIDTEGAMQQFFSANEKWYPLFRSMAQGPSVPATTFLGDVDSSEPLNWDTSVGPWVMLQGVPEKEEERAVLANFLDSMQTTLLDLPVDETTKEDELDLHFLEEGRRVLVLSRFHVMQGYEQGSILSSDLLFTTCWSELMHLHLDGTIDAGSVVIVPGVDIADLRRFASMNLQQPLKWLGSDIDFEVTAFEMGSPSIRFIYKLSEMPTEVGE